MIAREAGKAVEFGKCFFGFSLSEQLHGTLKFLLQLRFRIAGCSLFFARIAKDLVAENVGHYARGNKVLRPRLRRPETFLAACVSMTTRSLALSECVVCSSSLVRA